MNPAAPSRRTLLRSLGHAGLGAAALPLLGRRPALAAAPALKTVEPGTLTVAINGDMPMTEVRDGRLGGTDGAMISAIAERLGLVAKPALMEWSATIESVKTGRADVMLGNMGWTPTRAKVLLITDAIYYAGTFVTMKKDAPLGASASIADLKGKSIGTLTGFTIVPEMKKVPGTTEVKLYDTSDACVRDIAAGRLDYAILDAPTVDYMILKSPELGLRQIPIVADAAFPQMTSKQHTVMGMNAENPDLFDAVNAGVRWLWATKRNAALLAQYGVKDPDYLVPPAVNPRLGVDRDEKGGLVGHGAHAVKDFSSVFAA